MESVFFCASACFVSIDVYLELEATFSSTERALTVKSGANSSLRFSSGIRHINLASNRGGLQTAGDFSPVFADWQGLLQLRPGRDFDLSFFAAALRNKYRLQPDRFRVLYNCTDLPGRRGCDQFYGEEQGLESYRYTTGVFHLELQKKSGGAPGFAAYVTWQGQREDENTAIDSRLAWFPCRSGICPKFNGPLTRADGFKAEAYKSKLRSEKFAVGWRRHNALSANWRSVIGGGWGRQHTEGFQQGSATYSLPSTEFTLAAQDARFDRQLSSYFLYGHWRYQKAGYQLASGLRLVHYDHTGEYLLVPRASWRYQARHNLRIRADLGRYIQPPTHRELLSATAPLKSQKSTQANLGAVYQLSEQIQWQVEVYGKLLRDVISYQLDDLTLHYSGANDANAYAYGFNSQLNGQFSHLHGVVNYSYLVAREDLTKDGRGFIPGPTDQRHTASLLLRDYMNLRFNKVRSSFVYLRMLLGTGVPYTPQRLDLDDPRRLTDGRRHSRRTGTYHRFDMGLVQEWEIMARTIRSRIEVLNVFDQFNVVGHSYLLTPTQEVVELPKALGRRYYNLSLAVVLGD